jgi:hypothetical protein
MEFLLEISTLVENRLGRPHVQSTRVGLLFSLGGEGQGVSRQGERPVVHSVGDGAVAKDFPQVHTQLSR